MGAVWTRVWSDPHATRSQLAASVVQLHPRRLWGSYEGQGKRWGGVRAGFTIVMAGCSDRARADPRSDKATEGGQSRILGLKHAFWPRMSAFVSELRHSLAGVTMQS